MHHHAWLIFVILVEMGVIMVIRPDGLELLTLGDLSTSASQNGGITGLIHCPWPVFFCFVFFLNQKFLEVCHVLYLH